MKTFCSFLLISLLLPIALFSQNVPKPEAPELTIKNQSDYSETFIKGFYICPPEYKTILLDSNKLVLNQTEIWEFPDYIPLNFPLQLSGKNDKNDVQLFINRINQSTIAYRFQINQKHNESGWIEGTADMLPTFFFGVEMCEDDKTGEVYDAEQFIDRKNGTNIKIGKGTNGGLRAKVEGASLDKKFVLKYAESPTLRTENGRSENNCDCPDYSFSKAGEPPLISHKIGAHKIIVCGYLDSVSYFDNNIKRGVKLSDSSFYAGGFSVFNCTGSEPVLLFDETEYYLDLIKPLKDELQIVRLKNMPTGNSLKYELTPVVTFRFIEKDGELKEVHSFEFPVHQYDDEFLNNLKSEIEKIKNDPSKQGSYQEYLINYNFIQAIKNPDKYAQILKSMGPFDGYLGPVFRDILWYYSVFEKSEQRNEKTNEANNEIKRIGYLNETPVKQLFNVLQLKEFSDPEFTTQQTFVTFSSPMPDSPVIRTRDWLSAEDLEFLMSVLDSEQECKCLVSAFSSNLPHGAKATIGGLAGLFLDAYRKDKVITNGLILSPTNNASLEEELKQWWIVFQKNETINTLNFGGTYKFGEASKGEAGGIIQIHPISDTLLLFHLEANRGKPSYNGGELNGEITVYKNNRGTFYSRDKNGRFFNCQLNFIFNNNSLEIKTINAVCGFGYGVTADGIYKKTSSEIPKTYYDRSGNEHKFLPTLQNTNKQYKVGDIDVIITQTKNNNQQFYSEFICRGNIKTFKNNIPIDSLIFNDMDPVGSSYGLNFETQPFSDLIVGSKFGDYSGQLLLITKTGKIEEYPGGSFFIHKNKKFIVSTWHIDLSGLTIYDIEKQKEVMQKELPVYLSDWYYLEGNYYSAKWEGNAETNEIYQLDFEQFELVKTDKSLDEIKKGEKVEIFNTDCACD